MNNLNRRLKWTLAVALSFLTSVNVAFANEVNFYTQLPQGELDNILQEFTTETGIKVNLIEKPLGQGILDQMKQQKADSPVDVVHFSGISNLLKTSVMGLNQPVASEALVKNLPARVIDDDLLWFGLTERVRIVAASNARTTEGEFLRYEDLGKPHLRGRVCTRSMMHGYSVGMTTSMFVNRGKDRTRRWLEGLKDNLARPPEGNDRDQVEAVYLGECDFAILNHYYVKRMLEDEAQKAWLDSVYLVFPNQSDRGAYASASGISLAKHAPNPEQGIRLMEFLSKPENQSQIADLTGEYPVSKGARIPAYLER